MKAILTSAISVLMLAGCAGTYNRSVMPTAAASLQKDTAGCKARWTAKEFTTYSAWQACQLTAERGFAAPKAIPDDIAKKLEAAIAEGLRDPEYLKASPGDVPVIAFMPGAEWQKRLDAMNKTLQPFAEEMKAQEQK